MARTRPWASRLAHADTTRSALASTPTTPPPIVLEVDAGACAGVPCWTGRTQRWLRAVAVAYDLRYDRDVRPHMGANSISRAKLLAVAAARARFADHGTGRNCRPTTKTLARLAGCDKRTVRRANRALRLLGVATEVLRGRQRTRVERMASWRVGDRGRGWASVYALHDDAALARTVGLLSSHPEGSPLREKPSGKSVLTTGGRRPSGVGEGGAQRRAGPDSGGSRLAARWRADPTSPPWARRHSAHAWAAVLTAPAAAGWSSRDVNTAIRDWAGVHGGWLPDAPHRPIGLLGAVLHWHGDTAVRPAALDEAREAAELAAARERVAAQLAARERVAAAREAGRAALGGAGHTAARAAAAQIAARAAAKRAAGAAVELNAAAALVAAVRG